jgi:hypothetical protein
MNASQWIGLWLHVAAAVVMTSTVAIVVVGLATVLNRKDERRGGCRGTGCRLEAGRHGCTKTRAVEGPAARDLATLARAGWVGRETVRKWEGE